MNTKLDTTTRDLPDDEAGLREEILFLSAPCGPRTQGGWITEPGAVFNRRRARSYAAWARWWAWIGSGSHEAECYRLALDCEIEAARKEADPGYLASLFDRTEMEIP